MRVALVSCCKTKLSHRAKAKNIYTGDLFKKIRQYTELNHDGWMILSALLGLVSTEEMIEPYEYTLIGKSKKDKQEWSDRVFRQIEKIYNPLETEIYIFAGMDYRQYLLPQLEQAGYSVKVPLKGLGIGQQKGWLKKELSA